MRDSSDGRNFQMVKSKNEAENINTKAVKRGETIGLPSMVGYKSI